MRLWRHWRFRAWRERVSERVAMRVAWAMPRRVTMWCAVRVGAHATTGEHGATIVPELTLLDALDRWDV